MTSQAVSPKAVGGGIGAGAGAAIATVFWIIATNTFWEGTFDEQELAYLIGGTGTALAALLAFGSAYWVKDPLREDPAESKDEA